MMFLAADTKEQEILDILEIWEKLSAINKIILLIVVAVSAYLLFWWIIKTARNKPSYRFFFKRNLNDEVPKIGCLPHPLIIFVIVFLINGRIIIGKEVEFYPR